MGIEQDTAEATVLRNGRMNATTLREAILADNSEADERKQVTAFGQTFWVRGMTARERDQYEASIAIMKQNRRNGVDVEFNRINVRARLVAMVCVDDWGARIFSDNDVDALGEKSGKTVDYLWSVGREMSGMTDADVEELEKN